MDSREFITPAAARENSFLPSFAEVPLEFLNSELLSLTRGVLDEATVRFSHHAPQDIQRKVEFDGGIK